MHCSGAGDECTDQALCSLSCTLIRRSVHLVMSALIRRSVHLGMLFCGHILRGGASHLFFCCVLRFLRTASSY